jgi:hypothetical protein
MFFRFGVALLLVVSTSLAGTALEKRNLELKRAISRQYYQLERLREQHSGKRVVAQQLAAPNRLVGKLEEAAGSEQSTQPSRQERTPNRKPRAKSSPPRL